MRHHRLKKMKHGRLLMAVLRRLWHKNYIGSSPYNYSSLILPGFSICFLQLVFYISIFVRSKSNLGAKNLIGNTQLSGLVCCLGFILILEVYSVVLWFLENVPLYISYICNFSHICNFWLDFLHRYVDDKYAVCPVVALAEHLLILQQLPGSAFQESHYIISALLNEEIDIEMISIFTLTDMLIHAKMAPLSSFWWILGTI